jgi:DNA uptake protein ComE-like DNA-binding protein
MSHKVRINLANPAELLELAGLGPEQVTAIIKFRVEHGPITDVRQLERILGEWRVPEALATEIDFDPAEATAPEAPGA